MACDKTILKRFNRSSRKDFAGKVVNLLLNKLMVKKGKDHILNGFPQAAIYAFDHIGISINLDGRYENNELPYLIAYIKDINKTGDTCIDIGANIGNHSLFFSTYYRKVLAFEPNPKTFKLLALNSSLAKNIHPHEVGLSSEERLASISFPRFNFGAASIASTGHGEMDTDSFNVQLRTLDSIDLGSERVNLIKIDVEGHELQVLQGSQETIRKHKPVIVFEQHRDDFSNGSSPVIDLIRSLGYQSFAVSEKGPTFKWPLISVLSRLLVGERISIRKVSFFNPQFYPMIIAIPD
jgi:FkbM family methyltransferase